MLTKSCCNQLTRRRLQPAPIKAPLDD